MRTTVRRRLTAALVMVTALLCGCGGGGGGGGGAPSGRAAITVNWPLRTRLIPVAANSIRVDFSMGDRVIATQVIARPTQGGTSTTVIGGLSIGNAVLKAAAYPNADGVGVVAQAVGTTSLTIQAGQTAHVTLSLDSTVAHVDLSPAEPKVVAGQTTRLVATARDAADNVVLTSPQTLLWDTTDHGVATVDSDGVLHGATAGHAEVTVTESESGKAASVTAIVVPTTPVAWWKADGNAQDAVGGNNGTVFGNVTYGPGRVGQAFVFDGVSSRVAVPDADSLKITGSLTIDAWVNVRSIPTALWGLILFRGDNRPNLDPYFLGVGFDGNVHFEIGSADRQNATHISAPIPIGRWVHVTATLADWNGQMRIYLDGSVVAEATTNARPFRDLDPNSLPGIAIGNTNDPSTFDFPFDGSIDELKVFNAVVPP